MLLSDLGGFVEIIAIMTALLVGSFRDFLFTASIMNKIFLEEKEATEQKPRQRALSNATVRPIDESQDEPSISPLSRLAPKLHGSFGIQNTNISLEQKIEQEYLLVKVLGRQPFRFSLKEHLFSLILCCKRYRKKIKSRQE